MIRYDEYASARAEAARMMREAGLVISEAEVEAMDVADFGLGRLRREGAQILSLFDTEKLSARVIALFPGQVEPEHTHVPSPSDGFPGKYEVLRAIWGTLYVYLPGEGSVAPPPGKAECYTGREERVLRPCDVLVIEPGTPHWFAAGPEGAVFYTISTTTRDMTDQFTDPAVVRRTVIEGGC